MWTHPVFYAVARGRRTGVFTFWEDCFPQVNKYRGAVFKKFSDYFDARDFVTNCRNGYPAKNNISSPGPRPENISSSLPPGAGTKDAQETSPPVVVETELQREARLAEEKWRAQHKDYVGGPKLSRRVRLVGNHGRTRGKSTKRRYSRH